MKGIQPCLIPWVKRTRVLTAVTLCGLRAGFPRFVCNCNVAVALLHMAGGFRACEPGGAYSSPGVMAMITARSRTLMAAHSRAPMVGLALA